MTSRSPSAGLHAGAAICVCLFGGAGHARADESHYHNYPVGDRALGMGGAYRAIADDSSGAYYNPAGLAEVPTTSFSLAAALYGLSREKRTIESISGESSVSSFITYPTTAAWIFAVREGRTAETATESGVGRIRAALSVVTPDNDVRRSALVAPGILLLAENVEDSTLWAGASLAFKLHPRISLGATMYALFRSGIYALELDAAASPTSPVASVRLDAKLTHYSLLAVIGVLFRPFESISTALVFRTPSMRVAGSASETLILPGSGVEEAEEDFKVKQPWQLALGFAWSKKRNFAVALDLVFHGHVGPYETLQDGPVNVEKHFVVNANLGGEWYVNPRWPLRAGFFTNFSAFSADQIDGGGANDDDFVVGLLGDDIDLFGVTAATGWEIDNASLSLGVSYAFGNSSTPLLGIPMDRRRSYIFLGIGTSFYF